MFEDSQEVRAEFVIVTALLVDECRLLLPGQIDRLIEERLELLRVLVSHRDRPRCRQSAAVR